MYKKSPAMPRSFVCCSERVKERGLFHFLFEFHQLFKSRFVGGVCLGQFGLGILIPGLCLQEPVLIVVYFRGCQVGFQFSLLAV